VGKKRGARSHPRGIFPLHAKFFRPRYSSVTETTEANFREKSEVEARNATRKPAVDKRQKDIEMSYDMERRKQNMRNNSSQDWPACGFGNGFLQSCALFGTLRAPDVDYEVMKPKNHFKIM
jgi:hypothetical protein